VINAMVELGEDAGDVLMIGGDSDAAEMYQMKLVLDGYRVFTGDHGGDPAAHPAGWRPDMLLIDLDARGGTQPRDLQRARSDPFFAGVPALLLSSQSESELRQRGYRLGPIDYLLRTG
jgi:phosphoserine phosphatase RsbU/P